MDPHSVGVTHRQQRHRVVAPSDDAVDTRWREPFPFAVVAVVGLVGVTHDRSEVCARIESVG